jgi:hypothetical protein
MFAAEGQTDAEDIHGLRLPDPTMGNRDFV